MMLSIINITAKILHSDVDQVANITFLASFEVDHQKESKFQCWASLILRLKNYGLLIKVRSLHLWCIKIILRTWHFDHQQYWDHDLDLTQYYAIKNKTTPTLLSVTIFQPWRWSSTVLGKTLTLIINIIKTVRWWLTVLVVNIHNVNNQQYWDLDFEHDWVSKTWYHKKVHTWSWLWIWIVQ